MKSVICILVFLLPFCIATNTCGTISLSAEDTCVFPSNGLFKCFDVAHPSYVTASSGAVLSYNHDCVNVITGDTTGCIYQEDAQLLCLKATPDYLYSFSFTATDSCDQTAVQSVTVSIPSSISGNIQCLDADTCISNCVEQCKETRYDLITESGVVAGYVILKNKLNWEVSAEIVTFQGTVQDRGWWMSGIVFTIGSKRTVKEWAFGNEQSRWFEVISFRDAFPGETVPCASSVSVLVVAYVTNDKRNHNRVQERAYIGSCEVPSKRTFPLPPDVDCYRVDLPLCCECYIRTQSQNDWEGLCTLQTPSKRTGDNARVRNATCTRDHIWFSTENWCFVGGLQVGCSAGKTLTFTSPFALANYLADETTPRALTRSYIDPPHASLGGLAAETAALALNLKLDECSADWSSSCYNLIHFGVCKHPNNPSRTACEPFWGLTVGAIFDLANNALGGCSQDDVNKLYTCVRYINRAFVDGKRLWETPDFKPEGCGVQITSGAVTPVTSGFRFTSGSVTSGSVTSGPVTSAAVTSSPITSAAVTSSPVTSSPVTSAAVTSSPVTSSPVTSSPVTSSPVTSSPVTSSPVTSSPVTSSPVTSSPVTSSPVTSSPVTSSPVTSSPITSAPVTSSPITSAKITSSPLTTSPLSTGEITTGEEIPSRRNF